MPISTDLVRGNTFTVCKHIILQACIFIPFDLCILSLVFYPNVKSVYSLSAALHATMFSRAHKPTLASKSRAITKTLKLQVLCHIKQLETKQVCHVKNGLSCYPPIHALTHTHTHNNTHASARAHTERVGLRRILYRIFRESCSYFKNLP